MTQPWHIPKANQECVQRVAELIALKVQAEDVIALEGDLGSGKTTFARALIRSALADLTHDVPSPTFAIQQSYDGGRIPIHHVDLYRVEDANELDELGLEDLLKTGTLIVEWPERLADGPTANTLTITLTESAGPNERTLQVMPSGTWTTRVDRVRELYEFFGHRPAWQDVQLTHLQGDASTRSYARIVGGQCPALLMDSPPQADGPAVRDGKSYSQLAALAEDVRPFVAVARALSDLNLAAPNILAADLDHGILILEDFGDLVFAKALAANHTQEDLWRAAVDVLLHLRRDIADHTWTFADDTHYRLPVFTADIMHIECALLLDWYWPHVKGSNAPDDLRRAFDDIARPIFRRISASNRHWVLRDYHSPNLIWRPDQSGHARVGLIDFQDALRGPAEYDLVSLLQDARLDVSPELEHQLLNYYLTALEKLARDEAIDEIDRDEVRFRYHALGAQRAIKILGIFARLANRDAKPSYLQHIPRVWRYLERNLRHPELRDLKNWFDCHFQSDVRIAPPVS